MLRLAAPLVAILVALTPLQSLVLAGPDSDQLDVPRSRHQPRGSYSDCETTDAEYCVPVDEYTVIYCRDSTDQYGRTIKRTVQWRINRTNETAYVWCFNSKTKQKGPGSDLICEGNYITPRIKRIGRLEILVTCPEDEYQKIIGWSGFISSEDEADIFKFTLKRESSATVAMFSPRDDDTLDPYLELRASDGEAIASDDDSGEQGDGDSALISDVVIPPGSYRLAASDCCGGRGTYVVILRLYEQ